MKKIYLMGMVALVGASLTSCDDFLNDNRYPLSQQTANAEYWSNTVNVENQCNTLYNNYSGYGNGSGTGEFYFKSLSDDQAAGIVSGGAGFQNWTYTNVPASSTNWTSPYTEIRRCNLIIEGVTSGSLNGTTEGNNYLGIARLNRAFQYFQLVRMYGDVPLVETALDPDDDAELYGPRTDRNTVMDFVVADLDFAAQNISTQSSKTAWSKDLAYAMKAEVCLFEAAYSKYTGNTSRGETYYKEVINACTPLLSTYKISSNYQALYNSLRTDLSKNDEVIFMKAYEQGVFMHSLLDWTCSSTSILGITKDAFDSFLFTDGKPLALTSCDKSDVGELDADNNYSIAKPLAVRDGRLSQIIDPYVYYVGKTWARSNTMDMVSSTGYGVAKFDNLSIEYSDATTANRAYTSAPLYWQAQIYLAYVEAKAELGTITDSDIATYLNPLYERAGLPDQTLASLSSMNDPANNMGVSSLLWEIRRCRRAEFMLDKNIRYWDLVRWHQLELLDTTNHPNIQLGANISASDVQVSNKNGYLDASYGGMTRTFTSREYFFPIPTDQLNLNPNLKQNDGWE
jgi:hypothetical protein